MKTKIKYCIYFLCYGMALVNACKKPKTSDDASCKYSTDIKPIITAKCAIPGCHAAGAGFGDFTTYSGLKTRADNGRIHTNVFVLKIMPPATVDSLTTQEKEKLKCWLDNGALQN